MSDTPKNADKNEKTPDKGEVKNLADKLAAGKLDLSVEEVEERIAPSETNVFDK